MQQSVQILDGILHRIENNIRTQSGGAMTSHPPNRDTEEQKQEVCDLAYMKKIWAKYESIPNSHHEKTMNYWKERGHMNDDIVWCCSEKVHGANFSLITNGVDIIAGSRTQILDDNTKFYGGWRDVLQAEKARALQAFKLLNEKYKQQIKVVIIYGELFGGCYRHFDAQYMPKTTKSIQRGVYYSPNLHFYAFDIKTDLAVAARMENKEEKSAEDAEEEEIDGRLTVKEANAVFKSCGFLYAEVLKQGSFEEMLKFPVDSFESTIPGLLGLPAPCDPNTKQKIDNIAEGIVLRKWDDLDHKLVKLKAKKFLEIEQAQSEKGQKKKAKPKKGGKDLDAELSKKKALILKFQTEEFVDFVLRCVSQPRFESVCSKFGGFNADTQKDVIKEFGNDILKELKEEKPEIMQKLQKSEQGKLRGFIAMAVQVFMKPKIDALQE